MKKRLSPTLPHPICISHNLSLSIPRPLFHSPFSEVFFSFPPAIPQLLIYSLSKSSLLVPAIQLVPFHHISLSQAQAQWEANWPPTVPPAAYFAEGVPLTSDLRNTEQ